MGSDGGGGMSTANLGEAMRDLISRSQVDLRVSIVARVESYDPIRRCISAQPLIRQQYRDPETGENELERLPVINDVPVSFLGAGPYSIHFPLAVGDTVLLVFSDSSLDRWLVRGGIVDPEDDRAHALSDAIAIPGVRDFAHVPAPGNHGAALVIDAPEIHAGGTSPLVTRDEFNNHTHAVATTGSSSAQSGTAAIPTPVAGTSVLKGG